MFILVIDFYISVLLCVTVEPCCAPHCPEEPVQSSHHGGWQGCESIPFVCIDILYVYVHVCAVMTACEDGCNHIVNI